MGSWSLTHSRKTFRSVYYNINNDTVDTERTSIFRLFSLYFFLWCSISKRMTWFSYGTKRLYPNRRNMETTWYKDWQNFHWRDAIRYFEMLVQISKESYCYCPTSNAHHIVIYRIEKETIKNWSTWKFRNLLCTIRYFVKMKN